LANGKILKNTKFSSLFVPSNPGDGGGALGAAYIAWKNISNSRPKKNLTAYLGISFNNHDVELLIKKNKSFLNDKNFSVKFFKNEDLLCLNIAENISLQKVVGWFQGKMEWGPRALGNRSIICDPRNADIKNILNIKIKRRESFRPFAPSILSGHENQWLCDFIEEDKFMSRVLRFKENKKFLIPGVVHVDGTGRYQTVTVNDNPRYYKLIEKFYNITGVPILLNTSFNENEPIVSSPAEALDCFLRTKMDMLVLENYIINRK
jgi:carbamoyltransferase